MSERVLVGCTGFVGGNLAAKGNFTKNYHSTDVQQGFGQQNDLVVYAGVPAAMFLANHDPEADLAVMRAARENLRRLNAKQTVLVSSVCVFADSRGKTEADIPADDGLPAYGANRRQLECWVREDFPNALIVRLPALYGEGLKKNFLYDLHTITPSMLKQEKYAELAGQSELVRKGYSDRGNGFFALNGSVDAGALKAWFVASAFNALCFTDYRSTYQFYPLYRLWDDMQTALAEKLTVLHAATAPVTAEQVYQAVTGKTDWRNKLAATPYAYDLHTQYAERFGGTGNYLAEKQQELDEIARFMKHWKD